MKQQFEKLHVKQGFEHRTFHIKDIDAINLPKSLDVTIH